MFPSQKQKTVNTLKNITSNVVKNNNIPIVTNDGIIIGPYFIVYKNDEYLIQYGKNICYKTFTKTSAIAICQLMNTSNNRYEINKILKADHDAFFCKNDLYFIKNAYNSAKKNNNIVKTQILENKFTVTYEKYERAREILKKSIYNII